MVGVGIAAQVGRRAAQSLVARIRPRERRMFGQLGAKERVQVCELLVSRLPRRAPGGASWRGGRDGGDVWTHHDRHDGLLSRWRRVGRWRGGRGTALRLSDGAAPLVQQVQVGQWGATRTSATLPTTSLAQIGESQRRMPADDWRGRGGAEWVGGQIADRILWQIGQRRRR